MKQKHNEDSYGDDCMTLAECIDKIICKASKIPCPDKKRGRVWTVVKRELSKKGHCNGAYIQIISKLISEELAGLDEKTIRSLWAETETGMNEDADDEGESLPDMLSLYLETEILDEITTIASEETR